MKRLVVSQVEEVRKTPGKFNIDVLSRVEVEKHLTELVVKKLEKFRQGSLQPVINATGVVLHTGLGRAPVNIAIIDKLKSVSRYSNLEIRLDNGKRGQRNDHLSPLLCLLSGAEDGLAVNNNAAAVMLMLNTTAKNKDVIISRGELIEIGGSFRIPEVIRLSGCKLKEIGTTNKTHLADYENAISTRTGAIMICHPSNYEIQGFTQKPSVEEIVNLGVKYDLPVIYDLGSGSLVDTKVFGSDSEPVVPDIVNLGLDLVSFSGDKLLGGPQAGIIVGKKNWIGKCKKNQLLRALRLDKFIIKTLQLSLTEYLFNDSVPLKLDSIHSLTLTEKELENRCRNFLGKLSESIRKICELKKTIGRVGSGAYPILDLETWTVQICPTKQSTSGVSKKLRHWNPAIVCYIEDDKICIDLRAVSEEDETQIAAALTSILE